MKVKKKKNKDLRSLIFIVIFIAVISTIFFLLFSNYKELQFKRLTPSQQESQTLVGLSKYLNISATPRDYLYDDWVTAVGQRVPLKGEQMIIGTNGINGVGKYGDFTTDELEKVNDTFINTLQAKIKEYFTSYGFAENKINTNLNPNPVYFSTLAYEKEDLYCLSHIAKNSDPFGYITCGVIDRAQQSLQNEFSNVYEEQKKNFENEPIIFRVSKVDGDYAAGSATNIGGYQWLAQKTNGVWKTIWTGQDFPLCSDMAKYQVPSPLYPGCYNPATQDVQKTY